MDMIQVKSTKDRVLISINKKTIDKEFLFSMLERFRLERLASKVDFRGEIAGLGDKIKEAWWKQAGKRYMKG